MSNKTFKRVEINMKDFVSKSGLVPNIERFELSKRAALLRGIAEENNDEMNSHKAVLESYGIKSLSKLGEISLSGNVVPQAGLTKLSVDLKVNPKHEEVLFHSANMGVLQANGTVLLKPTGGRAQLLKAMPDPYLKNPIIPNVPIGNFVGIHPKLNVIPDLSKAKLISQIGKVQIQPLPTVKERLKVVPQIRSKTQALSTTIPVETAYWVGQFITLKDNMNVVFKSDLKRLVIIAEKVTVGKNVTFTWERPSGRKPAEYPKPKAPQAAETSSSDKKMHGVDGVNGLKGNSGFDGEKAPELEFWVSEMAGRPIFDFNGQDGGQGGGGQDGMPGGAGGRGQSGKTGYFLGIICDVYPGAGGNGGNGGAAGNGGDGGDGGHGGKVALYAPEEVIMTFAERFLITPDGGSAGAGGIPGGQGEGGRGGAVGKIVSNYSGPCKPKTGTKAGNSGTQGRKGTQGRSGVKGKRHADAIRLQVITEKAFSETFLDNFVASSKPIIHNISPSRVTSGETASIAGNGFSELDEVLINGVKVKPLVYSDTRMQFTVPNIEGGDSTVIVSRNNQVFSNQGSVFINPKILSAPKRVEPGTIVRIHGSGFTKKMYVYVNSQEMSDFKYISPTEIEFKIIRPVDIVLNQYGEKVKVKVLHADGTSSNDFELILETYQMYVFGDSIQWGQGLMEQDKFYSIIAAKIKESKHGIGFYNEVFAHSGAIIGAGNNKTGIREPGEVPSSYPTIIQQVESAAGPTDYVDLILLDGGFNDVEISNVLNPLGPSLAPLGEKYFYRDMKTLLTNVTHKYKNAKIIVTGYYQPISEKSDRLYVNAFLTALGISVGGPVGVGGSLLIGNVSFNEIVKRCKQVMELSKTHLQKAVDEVNATSNGSNRISFAHPNFGPDNAAFAGKPYLYGVNLNLSPQDNDIAGSRAGACSRSNRSGFDLSFCNLASAGHPNKAGANAYATAIEPFL